MANKNSYNPEVEAAELQKAMDGFEGMVLPDDKGENEPKKDKPSDGVTKLADVRSDKYLERVRKTVQDMKDDPVLSDLDDKS